METIIQDNGDENNINEVIYKQTESSIFQAASEKLHQLVQKSKNIASCNTNDESISDTQSIQVNLQKQVETGEITPFEAIRKQNDIKKQETSNIKKNSQLLDLEKYLRQQAELAKQRKQLKEKGVVKDKKQIVEKKRKINESEIVRKKRRTNKKNDIQFEDTNEFANENPAFDPICSTSVSNTKDNESGSEYIPSEEESSFDEKSKKGSRNKKSKEIMGKWKNGKKIMDDGDENIYHQRVQDSKFKHPTSFHAIDNLFKVPNCIWKKLHKYQKVCLRWLWELHSRSLGGLLGDEMGLGKTVQVIAFLASLDYSNLLSDGCRFRGLGPTLIVCPATILEQWLKHFHEWWPTFRVVLLHQSSSYQGDIGYLISSMKYGGILITSYSSILIHKDALFKVQWHYVILDEGHKIRNPDAKVSQVVKKFSTPHRLLLTGSPMQNSLKELWSLFDFILPGKLGTLAAFMEHCANPITRGGYSNATPLQEATALHVATMLKNAIMPYMLRRTKFDVQHQVQLPEKNEQVLFCSLTEEQKLIYKQLLRSDEVSTIIHEKSDTKRFRSKLLVALTALRKICNHPDLYLYSKNDIDSDEEVELEASIDSFGDWKKSGKMTVVRSLLKIWKKQNHRVLLFTQSRQMLGILETLVLKKEYTYLKMDGTTPMGQRQDLISKFNNNKSYFVFLLTTRVGGLGVNLTGANRVIIYDPDWNPATDAQARERAWRIGQDKNVTIYRLITAGTIEEKIYHRQIFKVLLSNRVLEDPRQRRLFRTSDLTELFNLNETINGAASESDKLFRESKLNPLQPNFSEGKIEAMKQLASALSKKLATSLTNEKTNVNNKSTEDAKSSGNTDKKEESSVDKPKSELIKNNEMDTDIGNSEVQFKDKDEEMKNKQNSENEKNVILEQLTKDKTKKKKKKRNEISALFEGEKVSCLIGRRLNNSEERSTVQTADDEYVLSKLFTKSAVNSAFQHDSVLSSTKSYSDKTPMEKLAQETAQEKMEFIRKSRKWCWIPSWDKNPEDEDSH